MDTASREPVESVPQRRSVRQRRAPVQFNFDQHCGYNMINWMYYRMIRNLKLSGGSQYKQYIHALLVNPEFGLKENTMPQMMGRLSQMIKIYKGYPDTPTLTEGITVPYKNEFMQAITQDIKELEQHGTWTTVTRKSVIGAKILPITWAFKVKRFTGSRLRKFKTRFCSMVDR